MRVLVTGSCGFIGTYLCTELLEAGCEVRGIDNFEKYGAVQRPYELVEGDCRNTERVLECLKGCDQLIAGAAKIGGIRYFHEFPYSLLAENERIMAATCDAAIEAYQRGTLEKVTYISSSMVYEGADFWPSHEGQEREIPPPLSSYGFQKLAVEYFARAAWDQYRLPYTIVRPFNCVGTGEGPYMSHVVPDLIRKLLSDDGPLHIRGGKQIRPYTYGKDLARGIRLAMESPDASGEDFNLATAESTTVWQLAVILWQKIRGLRSPHIVSDMAPLPYDVQCRIPDVTKAEKVLGFRAETSLSDMLDVVIDHIRSEETDHQDSIPQ
jgi:UDP-glucose 4-epimerase